ncbi:MAG: class I SAM-dependent methyltransferase [Acidimicrobiales bacterium]
MELDDRQRDNLANWSDRARVHAASQDYGVDRFATDPEHLSDVVRFDATRIGDLAGLDVAHLQCHIGTDTVSLARLGARVIGLDFSEVAIESARALAAAAGVEAEFVVANVYDASTAIGRTVDLVYTSVGVINWVADLDRWAAAIAGLLDPGGRFYLRDMHPSLWTFEEIDGVIAPHYRTLRASGEPFTFDQALTYTDGDHSQILNTRHHEWFHSFADIINALVGAGLSVTRLEEHAGLDWPIGPSAVLEGTQFYLPGELRHQVPQMFSLWAERSTT